MWRVLTKFLPSSVLLATVALVFMILFCMVYDRVYALVETARAVVP